MIHNIFHLVTFFSFLLVGGKVAILSVPNGYLRGIVLVRKIYNIICNNHVRMQLSVADYYSIIADHSSINDTNSCL